MTFLSPRAMHLSLGLLCLAGLLALAACSGGEPANPKAAGFVKTVKADMDRAEKYLAPPYDQKNHEALEQGLAKLFKEAARQGKPLDYAVVVLSDQGQALAGRTPAPGHPEGLPRKEDGLDYSRYDKVQELIKNRGAGSFVLYAPEGKLYVVCRPVKHGGPRSGGLCVAFVANTIEKDLGLTQEEFQALDFNS